VIAAVAYVDPGNFATNVSAGAKLGTMLIWVTVAASAVGMLVQYLSAKLGLVTGRSLPEVCRQRMPAWARQGMWLQAELVVIMTEVAEVVGGSIALNLLLGLPLALGAVLMVLTSFAVLGLRMRGRELFRPVVYGCLAVVTLGFAYQALRSGVAAGEVASGLKPRLSGTDSVYLAAGIVGATVMPHVVYLHSDLIKNESRVSARSVSRLIRTSRREIAAAMTIAAAANIAILLSATALSPDQAGSLEAAHAAFAQVTGALSAWSFAVALLASSLASICVGAQSGQAVMSGFLYQTSSLWLRRCVSLLPALGVLLLGVDPTRALVLSQVCLSFGIPFALTPLIWFTSRRAVMGDAVNRLPTVLVALAVLVAVVALNVFLLGSVLSS
jgi:manganese transport protein